VAAASLAVAALLSLPAFLYVRGADAPAELRFRIPMQLSAQAVSLNVAGVAAGALFNPLSIALLPDCPSIVFAARNAAAEPFSLYLRPSGNLAPQKLPDTEEASQVFWSADNRSIGFVAGGRLRRMRISGGTVEDVAPAPGFTGGTWNAKGVI